MDVLPEEVLALRKSADQAEPRQSFWANQEEGRKERLFGG